MTEAMNHRGSDVPFPSSLLTALFLARLLESRLRKVTLHAPTTAFRKAPDACTGVHTSGYEQDKAYPSNGTARSEALKLLIKPPAGLSNSTFALLK